MGQYFQVNGDYNIKTRDNGNIVLNTGGGGNVTVVGNLVVSGFTAAVTSQNLEVNDNIIVLNRGEVGPGVSAANDYLSGIQIDRGTLPDSTLVPRAAFLWNDGPATLAGTDDYVSGDTVDPADAGYWMIATGITNEFDQATYGFRDSNLKLRRILTEASVDGGDLTLIARGAGVVKITGTTDYTQEILDRVLASDPEVADVLPNKGYVDYAILNNPTFQIRAPNLQDTRVIIADADISSGAGSVAYYKTETGDLTLAESAIGVYVEGDQTAVFYSDRARVQDLEFAGGEIYITPSVTASTATDIYIRTDSTGVLRTNKALQLDHNASTPGQATNAHRLVSQSTIGPGDTGLYLVYPSSTLGRPKEELVSKKRALLFGMIF